MLALARAIPGHDRNVRSGRWDRLPGVELHGQTLGLIGFGKIGREVARRAHAFGMRIVYRDPVEAVGEQQAASTDLESLLAVSDVVSLHLPLTPETRHLVDARALKRMKPTAFLVNTARGGLVDESALEGALREGWIAGAAADVFEREPPGASTLLSLDNFVATPHAGGATRQAVLRMGLEAAENALAVLRGERPKHVANPDVYAHPRWRTAAARGEIRP
ncbi:MAG: 2-hydroxyacid dehydrogenase, partial [Anaerolineales bacterium]